MSAKDGVGGETLGTRLLDVPSQCGSLCPTLRQDIQQTDGWGKYLHFPLLFDFHCCFRSFFFPLDVEVVAVFVKSRAGTSGFIASFSNGIVTDKTWKCATRSPRNWYATDFDDGQWPAATEHSDNSGNEKVNGIAAKAKWIGPSDRFARYFYCRRRMTAFGDVPSAGGSKLPI